MAWMEWQNEEKTNHGYKFMYLFLYFLWYWGQPIYFVGVNCKPVQCYFFTSSEFFGQFTYLTGQKCCIDILICMQNGSCCSIFFFKVVTTFLCLWCGQQVCCRCWHCIFLKQLFYNLGTIFPSIDLRMLLLEYNKLCFEKQVVIWNYYICLSYCTIIWSISLWLFYLHKNLFFVFSKAVTQHKHSYVVKI